MKTGSQQTGSQQPIATSFVGLSDSLRSIQRLPNETIEQFHGRQQHAEFTANAIARVARDMQIDWRDTFEAVVGPFIDSQMGLAWSFFLPPPTSLITGRYDPIFLRVPRHVLTSYHSYFAIRDSIAILPTDAQNVIGETAWFEELHPSSTFMTIIFEPAKVAEAIDILTAVVRAGSQATPVQIQKLKASMDTLQLIQKREDDE